MPASLEFINNTGPWFISLLSIGKATVTNDIRISEAYGVNGKFPPARAVVSCGSVPYIFSFWGWLKGQPIFYIMSFLPTERTRKYKSTWWLFHSFCSVLSPSLSVTLTFQCQLMSEGKVWHQRTIGQTAVAWSI